MEMVIFWILAVTAVAAAIGVIAQRSAVRSALLLLVHFCSLAGLYILLNAQFLALVQVLIYAGAIVVLFLFVIMLLGAEQLRGIGDKVPLGERLHRILAVILAIALVGVFLFLIFTEGGGSSGDIPMIDTSPNKLGLMLFENYVLPFEITGVLLLTSLIGVVVLGRRKKGEEGDNA